MRSRPLSFALSLALTVLLSSDPARAAWGTSPVSGSVALCTAAGEQYGVKAVADGAGGAIVVWDDFRAGVGAIYAQRVTVAGSASWGTNGAPIRLATQALDLPDVASDGAGGAIIAWSDHRNGTDFDVYAQRVDASGTPQWTAGGVLVGGGAGDQEWPAIAPDGAGGAIVAWTNTTFGTSRTVWAQRLTPGGGLSWATGGVQLSTTLDDVQSLLATPTSAGGAAFVWSHWDYNFFFFRLVKIQSVDSAGTIRWGSDGLVVDPQPQVGRPRLSSDGAGGVIVGWQSNAVNLQRFDANGVGQWGTGGNPVACFTSGFAGLTSDGAGGAYVAATAPNLRVQHVSASGTFAWAPAGVPVCTAPNQQSFVTLARDAANRLTLAWSDTRSGAADLYVQRLDAAGTATWTADGVAVCTATRPQYFPGLAPSTNSGWIVAWEDYRNGATRDVYAQRVNRIGGLGDDPLVGVDEEVGSALSFAPPSPNPSTGTTLCRFALPHAGRAHLAVYDAAGRLVRTLANAELGPGEHVARWDGANVGGAPARSGLYLIRLEFAGRTLTRRVALTR